MTESACHSLPRNSSRNHLPTHNQHQQTIPNAQKKPVPKPRSRLKEKQMGVSMIERDSLEPNSIYTDSFQYDPCVITSGKSKWVKSFPFRICFSLHRSILEFRKNNCIIWLSLVSFPRIPHRTTKGTHTVSKCVILRKFHDHLFKRRHHIRILFQYQVIQNPKVEP